MSSESYEVEIKVKEINQNIEGNEEKRLWRDALNVVEIQSTVQTLKESFANLVGSQ